MSAFSSTGFTVLAWVNPDSTLLQGVGEEAADRIATQLLRDFVTLLKFRWNMELTIMSIEGTSYAYGINNRITVADRTIKNAIGDLQNHIEFLRGTVQATADELAEYRQCKRKWRVPDQVTDSSSGWEPQEPAGTSRGAKRKLYF